LKDLLSGATRRVTAGDVVYFPQGARAEWTVDRYVRKLAFCRTALPGYLITARNVARRVKGAVRGRSGRTAPGSGMFSSG
jgi:uncharacterized protein